jgi:hypothetical protein
MSFLTFPGLAPDGVPFLSAGAIAAFDPCVLGSGGTITIAAANNTGLLGWVLSPTTASGAESVPVLMAAQNIRWHLPISGTIGGGDVTTVAGQTTAGASATSPGTTLLALIGAFYSLEGATKAWTIGLDDTSNDCLQLVGFEKNIATGLWDGIAVAIPTVRQVGSTVEVS